MKTSFFTKASHQQQVVDGDNSVLNISLLKESFCNTDNSSFSEQKLNPSFGIPKHDFMNYNITRGKIPNSKNYNFIYPKLMKQLNKFNKTWSLFLHFLVFSYRKLPKAQSLPIASNRLLKYNLLAMMVLMVSAGSAFAAEVDLAIRQSVSNSVPAIGAPIKYTVYLVNQGNTTATNIVVEDIVPIGGLGSISATHASGSWSYITSTGVGTWTVASLAGGDSVRLEINGVALNSGVFFNLAQVKTSPDSDIDSAPGNTDLTEDDIATSCFSVPVQWYAGDEYTVEVPAPFSYGTGIAWFRNNLPITPSSTEAKVNPDNSLTIKAIGSYTFTTSLTQCSATGCCPIILQQGPIFDLALRKTPNLTTITAGAQVIYTLKAYNQGNVNATSVQISDYIPTGLTLADANWTQAGNVATLNTPIATIVAGDSATRTITFNVSPSYTGSLSNSAELSAARGPVGEAIVDIDSDLDNNPNNNGTVIDNAINGNGKTGGDNDNSDVGVITVTPPPVFDLALRKTSIASSVVAGGQITFDFEIINQGNQNATNIQISDYIPTGLTLADANWTQAGNIATLVNPFSLLTAGSTTNLSITFNVSPSASSAITNSAEISSARGPAGQIVTDFDSTPDANSTNDGVSQNDVITGNGKTGGDEDDFDISTINISTVAVYDLALRKALLNPGPYYPGSNLTYKIDVYNQGTAMATEVQLTDYIPTGLVLADPDWTQVGSTAIYNNPNLVILAGQMVPLTIDFVVSPSFLGGTIRNSAEISRAKGPVGEAIVDVDSNPDNNQSNDGTSVDDVINQNGKTGGDEDDFDFGDITVTPFASVGNFVWQDTNQNGIQDSGEPGIAGATVTLESPTGTFISNTTTASNGQYSFTGLIPGDYVIAFDRPTGYSSSTANSGGNDSIDSDANATTGKTGTYSLVGGQSNQTIDAGFYVQSCADISTIAALDGNICSGASTYLTATSSNGISINWYLVPSGGTAVFTTNSGQNHLVNPTTTTVYYAQLSTVSPGCPTDRTPIALVVNQSPLSPVSDSSVEICIGETSNLNSHIVNGISSSGGVFEWHVGSSSTSALVTNPLAVGAGTYYLFEKSLVGCYSNPAITIVTAKNCALIIDLSLLKTADKRTVNQNDNIVFTLQINNAGPDPATNVRIEDRLPSGLQFVSSSSMTNSSGLLSTIIPTIASGQTVYITYTTKAINGGTIINVAEVASVDQSDSDSTPGNGATVNEDDDDDEVINVMVPNPIADLSLQKLANNSTPSVGDNVTYSIRVTNSGPNNATNVEIKDILPAGLSLISATGADQNLVVGNVITASFATILSNSYEEFYIIAKVTGSGSILNRAEITKSDQQDPDSTPNNGGDEDDDDTNTITVQQPCNPTTPLISSANPYICPGENVSISAIGCNGTVVWSNGMTGNIITVNPSVTTTYNARCQVSTCFSPNSNNVQIIVSSIVPPLIAASSTTVCAGGSVTLTASGCTGTVTWSNGSLGASVVVSPTASVTNYSATCSVLTCVSNTSNVVAVTIAGSPAIPQLSATNSNICSGQSTTLTAALCTGTVTWSGGQTGASISVSPLITTSYTATCSVGSCVSSQSTSLAINVGASQTPSIIASKENTCGGEPVTLTVSNCIGGILWSNGGTTLSVSVTPSITTTYTVTCGTGTCAATTQKTINVGGLGMTPTITTPTNNICANTPVLLSATNCTGTISWSLTSNTAVVLGTGSTFQVTPTTSVSYTATCATGTGCSGYASVAINVISNSTPPIVTSASEKICAGDSLVFTAHNCLGVVTWSSGATGNVIIVRPIVNTTYSATCTINSCVSPSSTPVLVQVLTQTPTITASSETVCLGGNTTLTASGCTGTLRWSTGDLTASITVSPTVQTTYTATCTVQGCAGVASKVINIGTIVAPTLTASTDSVCAGSSAVLTATNCSSGLVWNNGATTNSITVTPTVTTTYSATCGTGICTASKSITVTVLGTSMTEIPVITTSKTPVICLGDSVTLSASASGTYTHIWSNGATTSSIKVKTAGLFTVQFVNTGGCRSANSTAVAVAITNCDTTKAVADIQVTILGNKTNVSIGDTVIYTIQIKNNGPSVATNVVVVNEVPEGLIILGGTPGLLTEGTNLKTTITTLAVGESKTYTYSTKLTKAGSISNVVKKISADQTDPVVINNMDEFTIECSTCQETCVSTAFKADTIRQSNGSYNIKFTALIKNCGNVALDSVELVENLSAMFPSPTQFTIVQKPTSNVGSTVVANNSFNGSTNTAVLNRLTSKLPIGKTDTVVFVINLLPMGTEGPYSTNTIAKAVGKTSFGINQSVSDVSNDGNVIVKALADPTVVRLFKSPSIAIVLSVKDTLKLSNGSYNVTFQAIVKNNGSIDLNNVIVTDTLSKYFGNPASYTMIGTPGLNLTSSLVSNPAFNGSSDPRLTLPSSNLSIGKQDTIIFIMNLVTGDKKEFQDQAIASGIGNLSNGTTSKVTDISNSGVMPDIPGSVPTPLIFNTENQGSEITACVGIALTTINKTKLGNGTYNVTYQAIVQNCGNLTLTNISICDTLSNTFSSPTEVKVIVKPFASAGSSLAVDTSFNGVTNTCLLKSASSSLISGKIDTLKWTINVKLNSNNGPFRNNVTVNSTSPSGQIVSDVSNDGINPAPAGSNPTILNFNDNIPDELIGLAKKLIGISKVANKEKVFDVEFSFVLKNYGIVPFSKVQLQDNLAYTFGDKVIIDSVYIKNPVTGLVANANFTGKGELTNMLADSLSSLPLNTTKTIGMVVRVDMSKADTLRYENIALGIGFFTGGSTSDPSADGTNPDKNLSGDPSDDSDPTVIDFTGLLDLVPNTPLGIAKSVDTLGSADGSYLLTYKVIVKNYGTIELDSVQLTDDLADVFSNKTQFTLIGEPTLNDSSTLKINASFDGDTVKTLLVASQSTLAAGASDTITFKVKIINNDLEAQTYLNTVNGTALSDTVLVADKSTDGLVPDKNNDGNPGNDSDPTGITIKPGIADTSAINVIVYGGVSPNGDGLNDVLVIKDKDNNINLTEDDNISIYIYNRWGHLVYRSENYFKEFPQDVDSNEPNGWDGSSNTGIRLEKDKYVPDGTYYYVVASTNLRLFGGKPYVNFITIKR